MENTKKVKKYDPFKELMAYFNFTALTLLVKSLTFIVGFFLFNNQIEFDLNNNVMKMINRAKNIINVFYLFNN